ncbi:MAG: hypothetical protein AB7N99_04960 [Simkaniaceae bacterium]|jgi:hypothetical protein|nr:hypothetical protein [Chlamydiia bacterium]
MAQDELTKEAYTGLFSDNFQLTNYAIKVAQKQIQSGNDELNVTHMLKEIRRNPPKLKDIQEEE